MTEDWRIEIIQIMPANGWLWRYAATRAEQASGWHRLPMWALYREPYIGEPDTERVDGLHPDTSFDCFAGIVRFGPNGEPRAVEYRHGDDLATERAIERGVRAAHKSAEQGSGA